MSIRLSRRKLSEFYATELINGRNISSQLAAYLLQTKRTRELDLIIRDIQLRLLEKGIVMASVISARKLTDSCLKSINKYISGEYSKSEVLINQVIKPEVIGGISISTPDKEFDGTIKRKLNKLRASKV